MSEAESQTQTAAPLVQANKPNPRKGRRAAAEEPEYQDWLTSKDDKDDYEIIKLNDNDEMPPTGQFFQVNGRFFILKAEMWHRVPSFLLSMIDEAITEKPVTNENNQLVGTRPQKRFTYEVFRG